MIVSFLHLIVGIRSHSKMCYPGLGWMDVNPSAWKRRLVQDVLVDCDLIDNSGEESTQTVIGGCECAVGALKGRTSSDDKVAGDVDLSVTRTTRNRDCSGYSFKSAMAPASVLRRRNLLERRSV